MDEKAKEALKLQFDKRLRLESPGARITSDAGLMAFRELDGAPGLTEMALTCLQETLICKWWLVAMPWRSRRSARIR